MKQKKMWKAVLASMVVIVTEVMESSFSLDIHCTTFDAFQASVQTHSTSGQHYFKLETDTNYWSIGESVKVSLQSKTIDSLKKNFKSYIIQAHNIDNHPVGRWEVVSNATTDIHSCSGIGDSLVNNHMIEQEFDQVVGLWYPSQSELTAGKIDFKAAVIAEHQGLDYVWKGIRSDTLFQKTQAVDNTEDSETNRDSSNEDEGQPPKKETDTETYENPTHDEQNGEQNHQLQTDESYREESEAMIKEAERRQKEIEKENQESEGSWAIEKERQLERDEQEYEHELEMFEEERAEEEAKRLYMIELEIKDQEEYERQMGRTKTTTDGSNVNDISINDIIDSGVSRLTVSISNLATLYVIVKLL